MTTTASEWRQRGRAEAAVELTLPSGITIKARRPGPLEFAEWDKLPLILSALDKNAAALSAQEAMEVAAFWKQVLVWCCVEPRVSETAAPDAEDEIHPRDLPEGDWTFIVAWAMRLQEAAAVGPFRRVGTDDRGDSDGEAVFAETKRADGNPGPGDGAGLRPGGGAKGSGVEGR